MMSELTIWTLGLAVVLLACHGYCAALPHAARKAMAAFPRDRWAGRILATVALLWAAWLVYQTPIGRFEYLKPWLYVVTPITIGLTLVWMQELLAARALGGLLLLYPAPILFWARLHDSQLSLVMTVVAYSMVIKGIALVLSPYWFRKAVERVMVSNRACRIIGSIGVMFDLLLVVLAVAVY